MKSPNKCIKAKGIIYDYFGKAVKNLYLNHFVMSDTVILIYLRTILNFLIDNLTVKLVILNIFYKKTVYDNKDKQENVELKTPSSIMI